MKGLVMGLVYLLLTSGSAKALVSELDTVRSSEEDIDHCTPEATKNKEVSFADQINNWQEYFESHQVPLELALIYPYYNVEAAAGLTHLSLRDLNYCEISEAALKRSLKNTPETKTIERLNTFFQSPAPDYQKMFSCLALAESLGDPDTATSERIYRQVTGKLNKPRGVKFYLDREQPKVSALNIGLFQFTPRVGGNINSCVKAWNAIFSSEKKCQINNDSDALRALASSAQNFNVFCGIHKIIETAAIQMKSKNASAHFLPGENCVSMHLRAGNAYNHFGPLQNSTGKNLDSLARCLAD